MATKKNSHTPLYVHDRYFDNINTKTLKQRLTQAAKKLRKLEFDAIAFSGMSGALLGPPLALLLNKSLILVRKVNDDTHSSKNVEGDRAAKTYIIVDDFTASGSTGDRIKEAILEFAPQAKCLGMYQMSRQYKYYGKRFELTPV